MSAPAAAAVTVADFLAYDGREGGLSGVSLVTVDVGPPLDQDEADALAEEVRAALAQFDVRAAVLVLRGQGQRPGLAPRPPAPAPAGEESGGGD